LHGRLSWNRQKRRCEALFHEAFARQRQPSFQHFRQIAVGDPMGQQRLGLAQCVQPRIVCGELHLAPRLSQWIDHCLGRRCEHVDRAIRPDAIEVGQELTIAGMVKEFFVFIVPNNI
jgi:hypothetical protein